MRPLIQKQLVYFLEHKLIFGKLFLQTNVHAWKCGINH